MGVLGIGGLLVPEEYGGAGMGTLEAVVVQEELGRALAPVPHLESSVLGADTILSAGSDEQKTRLLSGIAAGGTVITPAWLEPGGGWSAGGVQLRATTDGETVVLNGTKMHVSFARAADLMLVLARTGDGPQSIDLFLVSPNTPGVALTQLMSISSDTQYRVEFTEVRVPADARVGSAASGWRTLDRSMSRAAIVAGS